MLQRDYVLRLIEQFAKALGSILTLKKARQFDEAQESLSRAARSLVGMDVETLLALPLDQISSFLSSGGTMDRGRCLVIAEVLFEDGDLSQLRSDPIRAHASRLRALGLLFELFGRERRDEIPEADRYLGLMARLDAELNAYEPVPDVEIRRLRYLAREGEYARAEDLLFELIDAGDGAAVTTGIELYEAWLKRSDAELAGGGLPRAEVEEGLSQLRLRARSNG